MPLVALVLAMALWASTFVVLKVVFVEVSPLWVICARMWIAAIALLAMKRFWGKAHYQKGDWRLFAAMSLAEPCLYFVFEAKALLYTSAGQAGMVTAVLPLLTVGGAVLVLKEKASPRLWLGLAMALVGVLWLSAAGTVSADAPNPLLGNSLEFAAMVCAAIYSLSLKKLSDRYSPLWLTAIQAISGSLFFLPMALLSAPVPSGLSSQALLSMLYLGLGVTLGAYGLYNFAMARLPAARVAVFVNLIPLFSLVMAMVLLDERLSPSQLLASSLVLLGVMVSQQGAARDEKNAA
ncbi:DMT family transporter [Gallaecimonas pentaromativorans]|uniref:Threonine/homoserine efflux transporter RhtA n=1 Tax=Gallaecimonas pentaromativorans TaxID=584787 RepID=A0A3N1PQ05_9GAMM|nr:DMT family transporter [Gallaecimonas pentaromativorans]MED5524310.1 DMT family transporter [Pseudomonadota bacterium]ROQ30068.1 threonine/homoserine efflux transporter RhtA [Gallaecimonas pentaromativorans]